MDVKVKMEKALEKVGSHFKLTTLIQKRVRELIRGSPKLVDSSSKDLVSVVLDEILQDKISLTSE